MKYFLTNYTLFIKTIYIVYNGILNTLVFILHVQNYKKSLPDKR